MKTTAILTALLVSASLCFAGSKSGKGDAAKHEPAEMFKHLDTNNDSSVSKDEFLASKRAQKDPDKAKKHFEHMDSNKDGKLSKEEFAAMAEHHKKTDTPSSATKPEEKKPESPKPEEKKTEEKK